MPVPPVIQMYRYVMGSGGESGGVSNLLQGSEELGSTGVGRWGQNLINAVNSDQVNNPAGTEQTADQLDFQADKRARIIQDVTLVAGTEYTFSVWARAASGTQDFRLSYWDNVGRNFETSAHTASATWSPTTGRYSFTFTAATSGTFSMYIQNAADGATRRIYFWGAMLNVGATAADYIKTEFTGPSSPATPPMEFGDNFAGVTAYYSLRRFTRGANNNAIRVRRSSDDTEQDIGFDANGDLNTTALLAFVGTGGTDNGYVTTFYDQTGNGNNATNSTASEQPLVVSGGTLVTENGKAALDFDGVDDGFATSLAGTSTFDFYSVIRATSNDQFILPDNNSVNSSYYGYIARTDTSTTIHSNYGTPSLYVNGTLETPTTRSDVRTLLSTGSQLLNVHQGADTSAWSYIEMFRRSGFEFNGVAQEIIIFDSDQSSNRTGIESNINDHFSIYP